MSLPNSRQRPPSIYLSISSKIEVRRDSTEVTRSRVSLPNSRQQARRALYYLGVTHYEYGEGFIAHLPSKGEVRRALYYLGVTHYEYGEGFIAHLPQRSEGLDWGYEVEGLGRGYEVEERLRTMAAPDQRRGRGPKREELEEQQAAIWIVSDSVPFFSSLFALLKCHDPSYPPVVFTTSYLLSHLQNLYILRDRLGNNTHLLD